MQSRGMEVLSSTAGLSSQAKNGQEMNLRSALKADWLRRGAREKSGLYHEFNEAVARAMATGETRALAIIRNAATEHWQAAAWMLERRHPKKWGRRQNIMMDAGEGFKPVNIIIRKPDAT